MAASRSRPPLNGDSGTAHQSVERRPVSPFRGDLDLCELLRIVEGNADRNIVERLAEQVQQELRVALSSAEQISSLGGEPTIKLHPAGGPNQTQEMLRSA